MKKNTSPFVIGAGAVAVLSLTGAVFATGALAASTPDEQPLPNYTWAVPSDAPTRDPLPSYDPGAAESPSATPSASYTWAVPSDAPTRDPLPSYNPEAAAADTPSEHAEVHPTEQPYRPFESGSPCWGSLRHTQCTCAVQLWRRRPVQC